MPAHPKSAWRSELDDLMRGIAGAFLFGAPFLYTMEVWWKGNFTSPPRMLLLLGIAYLALVLLNLKGGFRTEQPRTRAQVLAESAEGLAIALLTAGLGLLAGGVGAVMTLWLKPSLRPAEFTVEPGQVRAAQVTVEGTLADERPTTPFDFVPARSDAEGVPIFSQDPTGATVRVVSYQNQG